MPLRVGTRGSRLAMAQTRRVCHELEQKGVRTEEVVIKTKGDQRTNVPLHRVGGQGIFVRALDDAILDGSIDCAVHSMKDIPAYRPKGVITAAVLPRDSPADFLVHDIPLEELKTIGTSSTRRKAQLLRSALTAEIAELRGNVDTRIKKFRSGDYDGIVLAEAGMERLKLDLPGTQLKPEWFVPSPNQGIIAVVSRDNPESRNLFEDINDKKTYFDAEIERAVMEEIAGGCFTPQGVYCNDGFLIAEVVALDGSRWERIEDSVESAEDARYIGQKLRSLAYEIIEESRMVLGVEE